MSSFADLQSISSQLLADGYLARAIHGEQLTLAVMESEPDAELPEHRHVNEQFGMVIEGSVLFRVGMCGVLAMRQIPPASIVRVSAEREEPSSWTSSPRHAMTGPLHNGWSLGRLSGRTHGRPTTTELARRPIRHVGPVVRKDP
jgi:hypothetical protein